VKGVDDGSMRSFVSLEAGRSTRDLTVDVERKGATLFLERNTFTQ